MASSTLPMWPSSTATPTNAETNDFATEKDVSIESRDVSLKYSSYTTASSVITMSATLIAEEVSVSSASVSVVLARDTVGGSFTVAQGASDAAPVPGVGEQAVEVRGLSGKLYAAEDGGRVLLSWSDGDLFYSVAGDLSPEQALAIAESLK